MLKNIICRKQSHINKLPDVFIDNNREYKADEIIEGINAFLASIGSNLAKRMALQSGFFWISYRTLIVILCCQIKQM